MSKIIRLTESDLNRIIKNVLNETKTLISEGTVVGKTFTIYPEGTDIKSREYGHYMLNYAIKNLKILSVGEDNRNDGRFILRTHNPNTNDKSYLVGLRCDTKKFIRLNSGMGWKDPDLYVEFDLNSKKIVNVIANEICSNQALYDYRNTMKNGKIYCTPKQVAQNHLVDTYKHIGANGESVGGHPNCGTLNGCASCDGVVGPRTRSLLKKYQEDNGLKVTSRLDTQTWNMILQKLGKSIQDRYKNTPLYGQ